MKAATEYQFVCSSCSEEITASEPMRRALLDHGCVICGEIPSDRDFRRSRPTSGRSRRRLADGSERADSS
ncbi:MAG: hypothetical protein ABEJ28_11770 [Salinigranum sp.]